MLLSKLVLASLTLSIDHLGLIVSAEAALTEPFLDPMPRGDVDVDNKLRQILDVNEDSSLAAPYDRVKSGNLSKLGSILGHLVVQHEQQGQQSRRLDDTAKNEDPNILVDIIGNSVSKYTLEATLLNHPGVQHIVSCRDHACTAKVTVRQLPVLASLDDIRFMRPVLPYLSAGSVTSEGDKAIYANLVRINDGVDGTGIKIGVISDSFNCLGNASHDIASGDLPNATGMLQIVNDLNATECIEYGGTDEGRAMLQIVHDVAPGAQLFFRTGLRGYLDMTDAMLRLALESRVDIVVSDINYFDQPYFQDGRLAQTADQLADTYDISYFAAAGNWNFQSWDAPNGFVSSGLASSTGAELNSFGTDSRNFPILTIAAVVENEKTSTFYLQWDQPFWSVSGGAGCQSDLDLFILSSDGAILPVAATNNIGGDAVEMWQYSPNVTGVTNVTVQLAIGLKSGPAPQYMKLLCPDCPNGTFVDYSQNLYPSIVGIPNAASVAGVAATNALKTPAFEPKNVPHVEYFSSSGGVPILFDTDGNRLSEPDIRMQPRFTGPDDVANTFFGTKSAGTYHFTGTSAAAPHAAGAAALLMNLAPGGSASPALIYEALELTAVGMEENGNSGKYSFQSGYGLIDVQTAAEYVKSGSLQPSMAPTKQPKPSKKLVNKCFNIDKAKCGCKANSLKCAQKNTKNCSLSSVKATKTKETKMVIKKYKNYLKTC